VTQPTREAGRGKALRQPPVAMLAQLLDLPIFQPARVRTPEAVARLLAVNADAFVVAAYGQILPRSVLSIPRLGCINVHPSLLPRHRGASPIPASLLAGDTVTGVTIMLMDEGMDTGPILAVQGSNVSDEDDQLTLTSRLAIEGANLLLDTLVDIEAERLTPRPQDPNLATTSRLIGRADAIMDWTHPAIDLWRQVRAFAEWPQATTTWRGRSLRVLSAGFDPGKSVAPGRVAAWGPPSRSPEAIAIGTGEGVLLPSTVGLEGKRAMPIAAFLRGQSGIIGAQLGSAGGD
jgi:methionyl-tRNA formyltransferase